VEKRSRFDPWWVLLWVLVSTGLLCAIPLLTFRQWTFAAALGFGVPELVGIARRGDSLPPLTYVIRRYLPRWLVFPLVRGALWAATAYWLSASPTTLVGVGAAGALDGWLSNHFDVTFDAPGE
jgi:hypothetical protein